MEKENERARESEKESAHLRFRARKRQREPKRESERARARDLINAGEALEAKDTVDCVHTAPMNPFFCPIKKLVIHKNIFLFWIACTVRQCAHFLFQFDCVQFVSSQVIQHYRSTPWYHSLLNTLVQ